jgi:hypothetical protein
MLLVRNPEGKRPFRRPRSRWEDIRMNLREIVWEGMDWIHLGKVRHKWEALVEMVFHQGKYKLSRKGTKRSKFIFF